LIFEALAKRNGEDHEILSNSVLWHDSIIFAHGVVDDIRRTNLRANSRSHPGRQERSRGHRFRIARK
jgi:hypothetical protein